MPATAGARRSAVLAACVVLVVTGAAGTLVARHATARRPLAVWSEGDFFAAAAAPGAVPADVAPRRLRIAKIDVDASLERLHLDSKGMLQPPKDYAQPGWYVEGTAPGEPGPAVIAGHVDSVDGKAVFFRLHELRAGDIVEVWRGGQWLSFRVTGTAWYAKTRFPTAQVYGPTPDAQLRLITCGGGFDTTRRSYVDNLVVYATGTAGP